MTIAILHLSDIHLKADNTKNAIMNRINKIAQAITPYSTLIKSWFVVVSGDIAFSGKPEEYDIAKIFIDSLCQQLKNRIKPDQQVFLLIVPGNHDCNFSQTNNLRDLIIENIKPNEITESEYSEVMAVQQHFASFASYCMHSDNKPQIYQSINFPNGGEDITFNLLNSSWMSILDEQQGRLLFPIQVIKTNQDETSKQPDLVITVLHHPYSWFEAKNGRELKNIIENISDVILTGHEHVSDTYTKSKFTGQSMDYIEGAILQGETSGLSSQFNFIIFDFETKTQESFLFSWNQRSSSYDPSNQTIKPLIKNAYRTQNEYLLQPALEKELNDPGAKFSNPFKEEIFLDDIFIYPQFRRLNVIGEKEISQTIIKEEILDFIIQNKRILLIGAEKSGKTTLCRILFKELFMKGFIPIIIPGSDLKDCIENRLISNIKRAYENNYQSPTFTLYSQFEKSKKVLILDDFNYCPLNTKGKDRLLRLLMDRFETVILTANEAFRFEDLIAKTGNDLSFKHFITCEILEFNRTKRAELVGKWHRIGQEYTIDETEFNKKTVRDEKLITLLIGQNYIPSYPLFILVILQQMELREPIETTSGSYGYLYEAFITTAILKNLRKDITIDTIYSYLTELAYFLYEEKFESIQCEDLATWHDRFCEIYKLHLDFNKILVILENSSVLQINTGIVSFRYPYIYYYFIARYFRDHIGDEKIKDYIRNMSRRLHHSESANIIIFICYLSKDPFILTTILEAAREIFSTYVEYNIIDNSKFFNTLLTDIPLFLLDLDYPEEHRKFLSSEDELHDEVDNIDSYYIEKYDDKLDIDLQEILQINVAFKTIQILGQLTRNFHGSLKGEQKYQLANSCYSLGLRVMQFIFDIIETNKEDMIHSLADILKSQHTKWPYEKIKDEVGDLLFKIMEGLSFVIVKQISDSIGLDILSLTFSELVDNNQNISYRFIDLSVRLDYYQGFPEKEVFDLYKDVRKNYFSVSLLKHLVWYYLYLYYVKRELRESICKRLGIGQKATPINNADVKRLKG